jgi:hypothetical protein
LELLSYVRGEYSDDGKHLRIVLETSGAPLVVEANAATLEGILANIAGLLATARAAHSEGRVVPAITPTATQVEAAGDRVVLGFQLPSGAQHRFVLTKSSAAQLGQELVQSGRL